MKTLLLVRHAKSSWGDPALSDFDRPLSPRGLETAPRIGRLIRRKRWLPDLALVSPARRTLETWDQLRSNWKKDPAADQPPELYEASPETILALVADTPEDVRVLLVLGHNPGLERVAKLLAGPGSGAKVLTDLNRKFPTGALARLEFDGGWGEIQPQTARLTHFVRPRDLE